MSTLVCAAVSPAASIGLANYTLSGGVIQVGDGDVPDPVTDNLSGVTYNTDTDTLYTVLNNPEEMVELALDGSVLRSISLVNFEDTEGIVHLGGTKFGILEERRRNLVTVSIGLGMVASIDRNVDGTVIQLDPDFPDGAGGGSNDRIEGVAYDSSTDLAYVVRERLPQKIVRFDLSDAEAGGSFLVEEPFDIAAVAGLSDLAGLHYHSPTDTLLVVSHESLSLVEVTTDGTLLPGSISLAGLMGQPEGVTVGPDGTIYVVGEGDELALFTPIPEPSAIALLGLGGLGLLRRRRE